MVKVYQDVFTGLFYAQLMHSKFPHCYGKGSTADVAVRGLKMRINQIEYGASKKYIH